jgi:hypothetical protein
MPRVVQDNTKASTKTIFEGVGLPKYIEGTAQKGRGVIPTLIETSHEADRCLIREWRAAWTVSTLGPQVGAPE